MMDSRDHGGELGLLQILLGTLELLGVFPVRKLFQALRAFPWLKRIDAVSSGRNQKGGDSPLSVEGLPGAKHFPKINY
jgi:hypothetical protein